MRLGFILPSDAQRREIGRAQETIIEMRQDQIEYLEHLLRSWGVFGAFDSISVTWRAIKRVLRERP